MGNPFSRFKRKAECSDPRDSTLQESQESVTPALKVPCIQNDAWQDELRTGDAMPSFAPVVQAQQKNLNCATCNKRTKRCDIRQAGSLSVCKKCYMKKRRRKPDGAQMEFDSISDQIDVSASEASTSSPQEDGAVVDQQAIIIEHSLHKQSGKEIESNESSTLNCNESISNQNSSPQDDCAIDQESTVGEPCLHNESGTEIGSNKSITLNINRGICSQKRCLFCNTNRQDGRGQSKLVTVSSKARSKIFVDLGILLPRRAKTCKGHVKDGFIDKETAASLSIGSHNVHLSAPEIEALISDLRKLAQKKSIDFDTPYALPPEDFRALTGIYEKDFNAVFECITDSRSIRHVKERSPRMSLGIFLVKARTGLSHTVLAAVFGTPRRTISRVITNIRKLLMFSFVPKHLGVNHVSREEVICNHTSPVAKAIFSPDEDKVMLVADATYIYIQKSGNYSFQRRSFSVHKGRPLIKPMMIVTTTGYILDVHGPYLADGKNNDAQIMLAILKSQQSRLRAWLKQQDLFIVDRGFRDALQTVEEMGFQTAMPTFLAKGKQHTTQEANDSRLVTAVRWVVEACNMLIKTWKILNNVLPNNQITFAGDYVRIISALCNAFRPPRLQPTRDMQLRAERMLALSKQPNYLQQEIIQKKWENKRVIYQAVEQEMNEMPIPEFPKLTLEELGDLTLGVYQLKQAVSYTGEHFSSDGLYSLSYVKECSNVIKLQIQSRHVTSQKWHLWIRFESFAYSPSFQWYCKCKTGARVVGCCAHVASVLWYLGYYRHLGKDVVQINSAAQNAVEDAQEALLGWSESDTSEEELDAS